MADNKIKSIITALNSLSDEEKEALKSILGGVEPEKPKRHGPPKHVKNKIIKESEGNSSKRKRVIKIEPEDDDIEETPSSGRRAKSRGKRQGIRGTVDGAPCRQEPVQVGRKANVFPTMPEFNADKHLVEEDKEAWRKQKGKMTPRIRPGYVEVTCKRCRQTFEVGKALGHKNFVCDGCITRE